MGANKKFNFVKANKPKKYEFLAASPERRDDGSKLQAAFYMSRNYSLRWACVCVCECANIKNISGKGGGWNWDEYPGSPASWQPGIPESWQKEDRQCCRSRCRWHHFTSFITIMTWQDDRLQASSLNWSWRRKRTGCGCTGHGRSGKARGSVRAHPCTHTYIF